MTARSTVVFQSLGVPDRHYSEEEIRAIVGAIFRKLDTVPASRRAPAAKTALIDLFGMPKAGKTSATGNIERIFRREGCSVFCPPETAEIPEIRNRATADTLIFQARHVTGVRDYVLNLAHNRDFHFAVISRGLVDMLYWYERWVQEGKCSERHRQIVREDVYELLRLNLVDSFFFFVCDPEEAMRREYQNSLTTKMGSNMNPEALVKAKELYSAVLEHLDRNVPGLPIVTIDTTHLDEAETAAEVLRYLLPTLCDRFDVPGSQILLGSPTLLHAEATRSSCFEEQLKLRGHPSPTRLRSLGWVLWEEFGTAEQEDFYLGINSKSEVSPRQENVRIRRQGDFWFLYYKTGSSDRIFSHRYPILVPITEKEAEEMLGRYQILQRLKKTRTHLIRLGTLGADEPLCVLHLDTVEGLGKYAELRTLGSPGETHIAKLLELATELGFTPADITEGNYLSIISQKT